MKQLNSIICLILACICLTSCSSEKPQGIIAKEPISKTSFLLNTVVTITLYDSPNEELIDQSFKLIGDYENMFSRTIAASEISRLNSSGIKGVELSDESIELLTIGLEYSKRSEGAFDITVGPLTSLWDFTSQNPEIPPVEQIERAVSHIGYKKLIIDKNNASFETEGMEVDLGAIAKGYIADRTRDFLLEQGVKSAIINLGGNVLCIGEKPDGSPFKVGIQKPFKNRTETIAIMDIRNLSVVSSGVYERHFEYEGKEYHHIINPKDGYPYDNELLSVTILSEHSVDGDALSTTVFALGLEKGLELIEQTEHTDAVFITDDYKIHYTTGFEEKYNVVQE